MTLRAVSRLDGDGDLAPGARLGPYEIVALLGAGGMGRVYRAVDTRLGREVAIKALDPEAAADPARRRRFEREARLASAVNHPHVLTIFDVGEWDGRPCVVSELLEGRTLREHLRPGVLTARQAVDYAIEICRGLEALHARGIVHRDLKPENVFLTNDCRIKILDLGLAGPVRDREEPAVEPLDGLTTEGAGVGGTAAYMSPEQVRRLPLDFRSDIFACGVVLYEMLGRRRPFQEETAAETMTAVLRKEPRPLQQLDRSLPAALVRVVARCLEKRPEDRFHSAHDLALALEAALDPQTSSDLMARPAHGQAPLSSAPAASHVRRHPRGPFVHTVASLSLLLLGVWYAAPSGNPVKPDGDGPALLRYDTAGQQFAPFLKGIAADGVDSSRDGRWVAYTTYPKGELWRVGVGGAEPRRLVEPPLQAALPRWSPDGQRIAFAGRVPGRGWQVYIVSAEGGAVEVLGPENVTDPGWTPDGRRIVFGTVPDHPGPIFEWDLHARSLTIVPGSHRLFSPRPSPDGRYLAALGQNSYELMILDRHSAQWSKLRDGPVAYPAWTRDGSWLHFRSEHWGGAAAFARIDPVSGREEPVAVADQPTVMGGEWGAWSGLSPDDAPLVLSARYEPPS
jgi:serine/threonine protein kinase